jgi:uncharacterized protein (TIGR02118 family)
VFKFVTIYRRVDDEDALENFFSSTHLPLAEQLPGLQKSEVSRIVGKPGGDSRFHLMYELYFPSQDVLYKALGSEVGQELMSELKRWSDALLITWFYSQSWQEDTNQKILPSDEEE